jgi:hypothetical protein
MLDPLLKVGEYRLQIRCYPGEMVKCSCTNEGKNRTENEGSTKACQSAPLELLLWHYGIQGADLLDLEENKEGILNGSSKTRKEHSSCLP